jgi:hypothetical protein
MSSNKTSSNGSHAFPQIFTTEARIYIVQSTACCRNCGNLNRVVTLAAHPEVSKLPEGEFGFFLLFHIQRMPASLLQALKAFSPSYGLCFDDEDKTPFYRNTCAVCEYVFEEEDLTMEPGDAFSPWDEADYARIRIIDADYVVGYELRIDADDDYRSFEGIDAACGPESDIWDWYLNIPCE